MSYSLEKVKMKNEDDKLRLSCSIMGRFLRQCFDIVTKVGITFSSVYFLFFFFFFFLFPHGERLVHFHWVSTMPLNRKIFPRKQGISHESHDRGGKSRKTFPPDNTFYVILGQRSFLDLTQIHLNFFILRKFPNNWHVSFVCDLNWMH